MTEAERKRSKAEFDHELKLSAQKLRYQLLVGVVDSIRRVLIVATICICVYGTAYVGLYLPVEASAGKTTLITSTQTFLANVDAHVWLGWGVGVSGAVYGYAQKRKRTRERKEKDERIATIEKQIDPLRSSSGLLPDGGFPGGTQP